MISRKTSVTGNIVQFCQFLRQKGFAAGVEEEATVLQGLQFINYSNPTIFHLALKATLCKNKSQLEKEMDEKKVHIVENNEWKEGMASSIRCGVETLQHIAPSADGVILMVCDQPHVSSSLLNELITLQKKTVRPVITSQYKDAVGPPALFHRSVFPELLELNGDAGARKIVEKYKDKLATVSFEKGTIDIDTEDDYKALNQ